MKNEKLFAGLYVATVYAIGLYYGYKIGKTKGEADAYGACADQLQEVIQKHGIADKANSKDEES